MPDEDKFKALRDAGYRITPACMLCEHGKFPFGSLWGECKALQYVHGKHVGGPRNASIVTLGSCSKFKEDPTKVALSGLGAHEEFLPGRQEAELPESRGKKKRR